jgi:hypothetical protein
MASQSAIELAVVESTINFLRPMADRPVVNQLIRPRVFPHGTEFTIRCGAASPTRARSPKISCSIAKGSY